MGFFDMGPMEILLIVVVALIIWGPGKLPEIARTLGKAMRILRKSTSDFTAAVTKEISLEEKDSPPQPKAKSGDKTKEPPDVNKTEPHSGEVASPKDQ